MSVNKDCCWQCNTLYRDNLGPDDDKNFWRAYPMQGMIVCSQCGNKRCPRASDHKLECSGSNEPGQPWSRYI